MTHNQIYISLKQLKMISNHRKLLLSIIHITFLELNVLVITQLIHWSSKLQNTSQCSLEFVPLHSNHHLPDFIPLISDVLNGNPT